MWPKNITFMVIRGAIALAIVGLGFYCVAQGIHFFALPRVAGLISSHQWKPGEIAEVTSLKDRITLRGRVAHCAKREEGQYYVGLYFNQQEVTWNPYVKYRQSAEADDLEMRQLATQNRHRHQTILQRHRQW